MNDHIFVYNDIRSCLLCECKRSKQCPKNCYTILSSWIQQNPSKKQIDCLYIDVGHVPLAYCIKCPDLINCLLRESPNPERFTDPDFFEFVFYDWMTTIKDRDDRMIYLLFYHNLPMTATLFFDFEKEYRDFSQKAMLLVLIYILEKKEMLLLF